MKDKTKFEIEMIIITILVCGMTISIFTQFWFLAFMFFSSIKIIGALHEFDIITY